MRVLAKLARLEKAVSVGTRRVPTVMAVLLHSKWFSKKASLWEAS